MEPKNKVVETDRSAEIEQLKAQIVTLEQLLEVYEQETSSKSTKLEQALAQLQEHTQQLSHAETTLKALRSMLDSIGDPVVVTDQHGQFVFLNPAAETILGIRASSSLTNWARTWRDTQGLFLPDQTTPYPIEEFPLMQALRGESVDATEVFARTAEPLVENWLSVTARSLPDETGKIQGGVAVFHNVTSLKHTEVALRRSEAHSREQAQQLHHALQDLQKAQTQLIQTEKMSGIGQLVAGVAHEINNPISFVYGNITPANEYFQSLLRLLRLYQKHYPNPDLEIQAEIDEIGLDFLEEDLQKLLKSIRSGAERVRQIVLALRNFSRLDETGMKPVDLHQGLDNTLLILQNRLQSKKGLPAIQVFHQYGELPLVNCDASQLNQVFINILSNAIDAIETRLQVSTTFVPTITITTKQQGGAIVIYIQDNGVGMMPEVMQRLFEPFFTTKPVGQGTGLGLSVSYQIIEKHGGTIRVTSELGQGSQFAIILPIKEPSDSQKHNLAIRSEN
ncbi:PAS domain-containing sensor histidine kinase [Leptolyngbya sp. GGD]|uniref:PAS domain-containing sensor histidine kinase n=1 Tax=Leptolyngbya sp. GGD TaxID=2997907 RepID=UPI00227D63B4|nr:ATP-binding protein [Leptolyngbya sp. GGD]MCY6492784.1 ATP-binding protein [Leptolyngbya sp. GGD]